jgi:hypothetical protein
MLRSDFDKLGARERAKKMKEGSRSSTERPSRYYIGGGGPPSDGKVRGLATLQSQRRYTVHLIAIAHTSVIFTP